MMTPRGSLLRIGRRVILTAGLLLSAIGLAMAQLQFSGQTDYPVGNSPYGIAVGDFSGDKKLDLVVANTGDQTISILLGNGDGTFQPAIDVSVAASPAYAYVAVADFNGDGKLDLVLSNGNDIAILLGNGDGTFQTPVLYPVGSNYGAVWVADFNGDGKPDLLTVDGHDGLISVLLGNGDGTFQAPQVTTTGGSVPYVAIADFNGDGKLDVATGLRIGTAFSNTGSVIVMLGNGDGTFQAPVTSSVGFDPEFLVSSDFNHDGKQDLAIEGLTAACTPRYGCDYTKTVWALAGNGDGTFAPASPVTNVTQIYIGIGGATGGSTADALAVADLNNDGNPDLIVLNQAVGIQESNVVGASPRLDALLGNGDGTFQPLQTFLTATVPSWFLVGDINGDTLADLIVTSSPYQAGPNSFPGNSVGVLLNSTPSDTLSLTIAGNGTGTISSQPPILNCTASCIGNFAPGTTVTLIATPGGTSVFTGWSGACSGTGACSVVMNSTESVTATFTVLFPVSISVAGGGSGTVTSNPAGINCGSSCQADFLSGTAVTLTATPNSNSNFTGWSGACSGSGACTVTISAATSATATFALQDFSLSPASTALSLQPGGQGTDVITLAGVKGPFGSAVQLACAVAGPQPQPTCALSTASATPGSNSVTSTLTVSAPTTAAMQIPAGSFHLARSFYGLWLPLMFGATVVGGLRKRPHSSWMLGSFLLLLLFLQMACANNSSSSVTPPPLVNYMVTVTGVSGAVQHSAQVTVTVP